MIVNINNRDFIFHKVPNENGFYFTDVVTGLGMYDEMCRKKYGNPSNLNNVNRCISDFLKTEYGKQQNILTP